MRVFMLESPPRDIENLDGVAVRADAVECYEELELAYHLAKRSFERKRNIAKKFKYEFLLWLSGTRDIRNAVRKTAPEGECMLILFSGEVENVKEKRLDLKKTADLVRLENISLSRI